MSLIALYFKKMRLFTEIWHASNVDGIYKAVFFIVAVSIADRNHAPSISYSQFSTGKGVAHFPACESYKCKDHLDTIVGMAKFLLRQLAKKCSDSLVVDLRRHSVDMD